MMEIETGDKRVCQKGASAGLKQSAFYFGFESRGEKFVYFSVPFATVRCPYVNIQLISIRYFNKESQRSKHSTDFHLLAAVVVVLFFTSSQRHFFFFFFLALF